MIGDPFDRLGDEHELNRPRNGLGLLNHETRQLAVELAVDIVHLRIPFADGDRLRLIDLEKAVERVAEHLQGHGGYPGQVDVGFELGLGVEFDRALGDARRLVPHPFEIMAGFHPDDDEPQLARDGRAQVHVAHGFVVDLDLQPVQLVIRGNHLIRQTGIGLNQRLDRRTHLLNGRFAHQDQLRAEGFEFGVKESFHGRKFWEPQRHTMIGRREAGALVKVQPSFMLSRSARRHRPRFGNWKDS